MATNLGQPDDEDDLYLARGKEVEPYRPLMQGDIFKGISIPGLEDIEYEYVMVMVHPCTMRAGARVRDRIEMVPVTAYEKVPLRRWPDSHPRVFPLPALLPDQPKVHFAARFDERGMVPSTALTPDLRVAYLSEKGVLLLQQREIFARSRLDVPLDALRHASLPVLIEAELQTDWNDDLARRRIDAGEGELEALEAEAIEFDSFLSVTHSSGSLREQLRQTHLHAQVRRAVRDEIRARIGEME